MPTHAHNERTRSPDEPVTAHPGGSANRISIRIDANALAIVALVISSLCLGLFLMQTVLLPQIIDAKVQAGMAEARASMQQQVAQAQATATAGQQHARVALDKVEDFRAKLAAKGIDVPPLDGH